MDVNKTKPRTLPSMKSSDNLSGSGGRGNNQNSGTGLPMQILQSELDKTNQMIAQQQLKMSLQNNSKVSKLHHGR